MTLRPLLTSTVLAATLAAGLAGCASRAVDVQPLPASPVEFMTWDCDRIDDESDLVQQRATEVAWTLDERVGNNILALGVGVTVFWPALFAMRPDGLEAADLARLKGRYEALALASRDKGCPPAGEGLSAARAAALPLAVGERLVYEDRAEARGPAREWQLTVSALRRGETEFRSADPGPPPRLTARWLQDRAGNITLAPTGALLWPRLLRGELGLGAVIAGDLLVAGDPLARARLRGQVVAVGPQTVAGRLFDAAVVELFGDAERGDASTRVDGAIVVDRRSGLLLRLDLRSAQGSFSLQRRLVRVEPAG
ncbi:MAG: hypothetical protein Q8K45_05915 [Rubrivivax sp.]|nr:hypothetical protein [Rubrivivax sp.]